ncbi:hypothetical protein CCHR01_15561 [Colletotrichum chrysophilum]|uniref:Uncharacterized protein n=1 Tax=Colletotrichum chrysophilum TaxID=1836956 RepID=A0AAD9A5F9_9PEZI|nr:hypothetical protein K456DRAFT_491416 [Colletotrichum gloeosporioides 23]KAK1841808.1 hypothetical protein CCHR01_15561 [Colletotrichum chrysophilum]
MLFRAPRVQRPRLALLPPFSAQSRYAIKQTVLLMSGVGMISVGRAHCIMHPVVMGQAHEHDGRTRPGETAFPRKLSEQMRDMFGVRPASAVAF